MAMISWNQAYSVGVSEIDNQHKKLIDIINQLYDAMKKGEGNSVLDSTLQSMVDYTRTHFAYEERFMRAHNFKDYTAHKKLHDEFIKKVNDAQKSFKEGKKTLSIELFKFLQDWLVEHIKKNDKELVSFLTTKGCK